MTATASDSDLCPKCGYKRRQENESCARCGLIYALWTPEKAAEVVTLDGGAEALWADVDNNWHDEAKHETFLKHCSAAGMLAAAGRRYRERLDRVSTDPIAAKMQERLLTMAAATIVASRPMTSVPITRTTWFWVVIAVCGIAGLMSAFMFGRR